MLSKYIIYQMKNIVKTTQKNCLLLLDDGTVLLVKDTVNLVTI